MLFKYHCSWSDVTLFKLYKTQILLSSGMCGALLKMYWRFERSHCLHYQGKGII